MSWSDQARKIQSRKGSKLPAAHALSSATVAETVADALRESWGSVRNGTKALATVANSNVRTVRNWLDGANAPNSAELIKLMAVDDNVFRAVLDLAGRADSKPTNLTEEQRTALLAALKILEGNTDGDSLDRVHKVEGLHD